MRASHDVAEPLGLTYPKHPGRIAVKFAFVTDELPVVGVAGHLAFNAAVLG
jgi:hypothetical protein